MLNRYHVLIAVEQDIDAVACAATNLEIPSVTRYTIAIARMEKGRTEVPDFRQPERSPPVGFVNTSFIWSCSPLLSSSIKSGVSSCGRTRYRLPTSKEMP